MYTYTCNLKPLSDAKIIKSIINIFICHEINFIKFQIAQNGSKNQIAVIGKSSTTQCTKEAHWRTHEPVPNRCRQRIQMSHNEPNLTKKNLIPL